MSTAQQNLEAIQDIRRMMERSSRFIGLSGWSGVDAGISALVGAGAAWFRIREYYRNYNSIDDCVTCLRNDLLLIALAVLLAAVVSAVVFTFLKSKKTRRGILGAHIQKVNLEYTGTAGCWWPAAVKTHGT